jgi:hypothetical protein
MRVNYTLPGVLPDAPAGEAGERPAALFGEHLRRLQAPQVTDWRAVLRLNAPPGGLTGIAPPPAPHGIEVRDGASQRSWWRNMLLKHQDSLLEQDGERAAEAESAAASPTRRMIDWLSESQRSEDEIFARHFAEASD